MAILITGGSGYLGRLLAQRLNENAQDFISIDILPAPVTVKNSIYYEGDICDYPLMEKIFGRHPIEYVFHLATQIDFKAQSPKSLYDNNVRSTKNIAELCKSFKVKKLVFTSSNSIYLGNAPVHPFSEEDVPLPVDAYGRSKVFCEKMLGSYKDHFDSVIFRCPNIMDAGRVGMLSILFDFIRENRKCWMIGDGQINHQCLYAQDLFDAMFLSLKLKGSHIFNIGAQDVSTIREMYGDLVAHAKSKSRIKSLPQNFVVPWLKLFYRCGVSPLGPYQFRMLTKDFSFNISHVKMTLNWQPTLSNSQMLIKAYDSYIKNLGDLSSGNDVSANRSRMNMGIINIVKFFS
jgi:nucleoside-diphosphate-sugar epimerase